MGTVAIVSFYVVSEHLTSSAAHRYSPADRGSNSRGSNRRNNNSHSNSSSLATAVQDAYQHLPLVTTRNLSQRPAVPPVEHIPVSSITF